MSKKFFIGLLVASLLVLPGGCGSDDDDPVTHETNVNEAWDGAWTSSANGTATLATVNYDEVRAVIEAFGELSGSALEQLRNDNLEMYELYQSAKQGASETVNASVTRVMAVFEDCDVSRDKGSAKLTAVVIVSNDASYLPVFLNRIALTTTRTSANEWTASASNGGTFAISMPSEEEINLSGTLPGYECEFSARLKKNPSNSIQPAEILDGTWQFDGTSGGGYVAEGSTIYASLIPDKVSIAFSGTKEENSALKSSAASFYSVFLNEKDEGMPVLQNISPAGAGTLTQLHGNLYRFTTESGDESLIVVENTDEIFVFQTESSDNWQTCMFLPLKKVSVDLQKALGKTWRASEGEGGGYIDIEANSELLPEFLKDIGIISLTLRNSALSFSGAAWNDDGTITATMNIASSFSYTNDILEALNFPAEYLGHSENGRVTITPTGNFLQFEYDGEVYRLAFLSETEAFFSLDAGMEGQGEAMYYVRLSAE